MIKTYSITKFLLIAVAQRCIPFLNRDLQNVTCLDRNFTAVFSGSSIWAKNPNHLIKNIRDRGRGKSLTNTNSGLDLPVNENALKVSLAVG